MDTIIWLINNHQVYVGDFYKGELKAVPFEKADAWEVYGADDLEKLVDYMNYPLHYNQFKNSQLVILFDEEKNYEMLKRIKRCFRHCEAAAIKRIEPFLMQVLLKLGVHTKQIIEFAGKKYEYVKGEDKSFLLDACLEEEKDEEEALKLNPMDIYQVVLEYIEQGKLTMQSIEEAFKYELILSPTTLYTSHGQKEKCYLQVEDIILKDTIVTNGSILQAGEPIFKYHHQVQKMFGRIKTEERSKQVVKEGKVYLIKVLDENKGIWVLKDEVIGILGEKESTYEEVMKWYQEYIL